MMTTILKRIRMYAKTPDIFDSPLMLDTSEIGVKKIIIQAYLLLVGDKRLKMSFEKSFLHVFSYWCILPIINFGKPNSTFTFCPKSA